MTLLCNACVDVLSLTLYLSSLAAALSQLKGEERGAQHLGYSVIFIYKRDLSQPAAAARVRASVVGLFHLCDESLHRGGRNDSSSVLGLWDGPTGARLSPAVLLIHHRGLRREAEALTGHQ